MDITTAFWGMVINNYDETDLALVRHAYPDIIRKISFTPERGENGTPHIQAYIRLFRQQRLSYVKKLFPRGNFKALLADEYKLNAERYATKQDDTAEAPSVIINNPFPDPIVELTDVITTVRNELFVHVNVLDISERKAMEQIRLEEGWRVQHKPALAKFYVSTTYKAVKKEFWRNVWAHVETRDTHTHTHKADLFSQQENITNASSPRSSPPEDASYDSSDDRSCASSEASLIV